jgi:hypothetical protein
MNLKLRRHVTGIYSSDFEEFTGEISADIWNRLVELPVYKTLKPEDYADLYEIVRSVLIRYRQQKRS